MIANEQVSEGGRVAIEVTVDALEVKAWVLESGLVEEGTTWDGDDTQRKLKSAIAARVEHALLNDRRPSPVTHPSSCRRTRWQKASRSRWRRRFSAAL